MAEDEQFSLSWNNFNSNLSAGFHESLCRGDLVDVTLAADGQLVKAHRLVLSVCSPYFRKMFTQMPANQHAFVFLKDVSHAALKDLIQFMYCGEVNVKQDALPAFISTAEALQIKGLTETGESVPQTQPQTTTTVLTAAPVTVAKESTRITTVPVHQTIATTSRTFKSPRVSATTAYKLAAAAGDSEDSADDKVVQAMTMQAQATSTPATVHTTVKRTQKSITPQSAPASKRMKVQTSTADPLEAVEPTQITMHGDKDDEFINIPIEQLQNPKTEPHDTQYAEQASAAQVTEVEGHEQDTTYVEDDGTYGEIAKYDDSYFTEGDETAKAGQSSFGESYTATTDQGQEAQASSKKSQKNQPKILSVTSYMPPTSEISIVLPSNTQEKTPPKSVEKKNRPKKSDSDLIALHKGCKIKVSRSKLLQIYTEHPALYTTRLAEMVFGKETLLAVSKQQKDGNAIDLLDQNTLNSIIVHVLQVFKSQPVKITEKLVRSYLISKLNTLHSVITK
ncbi:modifier of mdg4-like isoform X4 [Culicoides brevitarsis]|uniref:modifier of mdg4-like isoform X4 n=1 Tax=Culicoides brevitarsis TaxID=469753 RepID=UPI00307C5563